MNEVLKVIQERYSCRGYLSEPLTKEEVQAIADAAIQAPSANNSQNWHITMVTDKALIEEMDTEALHMISETGDTALYERMIERGGKIFYGAPCMGFVFIKDKATLDCGIVVQNMALAATSLGFGNCICGLANFALQGDKSEAFKKKLNVPDGYEFGIAIMIGKAKIERQAHTPDTAKVSIV